MSKIRFYTDEHVPKAVIRGLRQRGADVMTVGEADRLGADDAEHRSLALAEGRVLVTKDVDFLRPASSGRSHEAIVQQDT